jgi:hypothetical protein
MEEIELELKERLKEFRKPAGRPGTKRKSAIKQNVENPEGVTFN